MTENRVIIRIDATSAPKVDVGGNVCKGQRLGGQSEGIVATCPVSGTVESIRFDPRTHEFVIAIKPPSPA